MTNNATKVEPISRLHKTYKRAKHKEVRPDIKASGKVYNRKILRNNIRMHAEHRGYRPSLAVLRIWHKWSEA